MSFTENTTVRAEPQFPDSVAVLIPAWDPPDALAGVVRELLWMGCNGIVVVDDGSHAERQRLFDQLSLSPDVTVLHHAARNEGKGASLKTGFRYLLAHHFDCIGVVTADADGQHTPVDIARVANVLADSRRFVLGARTLQQNAPLRSRLGNAITRWAFHLLTRRWVLDTQTGLRGFPVTLLPELVDLPGDRYEYEMTTLVHLCQSMGAPLEVPIATVYLDGNRSSHFDPLRDSARIYSALLRLALKKPASPVSLADEHGAY
jgi:glycosyltransferase involved in cell wall biosynthesis